MQAQPTILFSVDDNVPESMVNQLLESGALMDEIKKYALAHGGKLAKEYTVHMQMVDDGLGMQIQGRGECIGTIDDLTAIKQDLRLAKKSASKRPQ